MSPGALPFERWGCRECHGVDPAMTGKPELIIHKPTCSTQEGYREARMRERVARAKRRAERDAWVKSAEAKRLRDLRTSPAADVRISGAPENADGASPPPSPPRDGPDGQGETTPGEVTHPSPGAGDLDSDWHLDRDWKI